MATTLWYSTQIQLRSDDTVIFNGYFSVIQENPSDISGFRGLINHFYDASGDGTDLFRTTGFVSADSVFLIDENRFSDMGFTTKSFPYLNNIYNNNYFLIKQNPDSSGFGQVNTLNLLGYYQLQFLDVKFVHTPISEPTLPVPPIILTPSPTTLWFSSQVTLPDNTVIFNGYFSVVRAYPSDTYGLVTAFYDLSGTGSTSFVNDGFVGADKVFFLDTLKFSSTGTTITSFQYFKNLYSTSAVYSLQQSTSSDTVAVIFTQGQLLDTVNVTITNTAFSGPPAPVTLWYSTKVKLASDDTEIFNGYLTVSKIFENASEGLVTHFYDASNQGVDIFVNNGFYGSDSVFNIATSEFSYGGTIITSFPYFKNLYSNTYFYSLWTGEPNNYPGNWVGLLDASGESDVNGDGDLYNDDIEVIVTNVALSGPPSPTALLHVPKVKFESSSASFATLPTLALNGTSGLTISFWFYRTTLPTETVLYFGESTSSYIRIDAFGSGSPQYNMYLTLNDFPNNVFYEFNTVNTWNHFAVTLTYSAGNTSTHKVYANGVLRSTTENLPYPTSTYSRNKVGQFNGFMDELSVYNTVLSDTDIGSIYSTTQASLLPPPFAALWFSTKVNLESDNSEIFNGHFVVVKQNSTDTQGLVTRFYDASNAGVDILANNNYYGADCLFAFDSLRFTNSGTNITTFPYVKTLYSNAVFFTLYQDGGLSLVAPLDVTGESLATVEDVRVTLTTTQLSGRPPPVPVTTWYSTKVKLSSNNTEILNGYFSVVRDYVTDIEGRVTHFYDALNPGVDIFINNGFYGSDSVFLTNSNEFSVNGTIITSFPYFKNLYSNTYFYSLWTGNPNSYPGKWVGLLDASGESDVNGDGDSYNDDISVIVTNAPISGPPTVLVPPTDFISEISSSIPTIGGAVSLPSNIFTPSIIQQFNPTSGTDGQKRQLRSTVIELLFTSFADAETIDVPVAAIYLPSQISKVGVSTVKLLKTADTTSVAPLVLDTSVLSESVAFVCLIDQVGNAVLFNGSGTYSGSSVKITNVGGNSYAVVKTDDLGASTTSNAVAGYVIYYA